MTHVNSTLNLRKQIAIGRQYKFIMFKTNIKFLDAVPKLYLPALVIIHSYVI